MYPQNTAEAPIQTRYRHDPYRKVVTIPLTPDEVQARAAEATELIKAIYVEQAAIATRMREMRKKLRQLVEAHLSGKETKECECYDVYDYAAGAVETHAEGREVNRRAMTAEERQGDLPLEAA